MYCFYPFSYILNLLEDGPRWKKMADKLLPPRHDTLGVYTKISFGIVAGGGGWQDSKRPWSWWKQHWDQNFIFGEKKMADHCYHFIKVSCTCFLQETGRKWYYAQHHLLGLVLYSFPRSVIIKFHVMGGLKPEKFILSQFGKLGVQNPGISRVCPFWRFWERVWGDSQASLLASGGSQQPLVLAPWHVDASLQSLPSSSYGLLSCMWSNFLCLIRLTQTHYGLILACSNLQILIPNKVPFTGTRG